MISVSDIMLSIKTVMSVLKVVTRIITAHHIRLSVILVIMSVSTLKTDVILYIGINSGCGRVV
jgi:hypothetical protein